MSPHEDVSAFPVMSGFLNLPHVSVPQISVKGLVRGEHGSDSFPLLSQPVPHSLQVCTCLNNHSAERLAKTFSTFSVQTACTREAACFTMCIRHAVCTQSSHPQAPFCVQTSKGCSDKVLTCHPLCQSVMLDLSINIYEIVYQNCITQGRNLHCT